MLAHSSLSSININVNDRIIIISASIFLNGMTDSADLHEPLSPFSKTSPYQLKWSPYMNTQGTQVAG
jgi:hypothetical protein